MNEFSKWCEKKSEINWLNKLFFPKHREIWYISIWKNIWFESNWKWDDFKRPILVLKRLWTMFLIVSMTTKWKSNKFYHKIDDKYFWKSSFITLSQFKTIDKKRFIEKIWKLEESEFLEIKNRIKQLF